MKKQKYLVFLTIVILIIFSSCTAQQKEPAKLRIAVLPVLDVLPIYVAEAQGYFDQEGIEVDIVQVASAPERDQLMQAGQVEGMLNELVSTLIFNADGSKIEIVRFARTATPEYPIFRILASKDSDIENINDLKNIPIGISEGTVIEYTTDRLLQNAGLPQEEIEKIAVPKIPDRLTLLQSNQLQSANLPDPVASLAVLNGAVVIIDDTSLPSVSNSTLSFSVETIENNPEAIKSFLTAIEKAVADINSDKDKWNDLLVELNMLPQPLVGKYQLPDYPKASVPTEDQFDDAIKWIQEKGVSTDNLSYNTSVNNSFLP